MCVDEHTKDPSKIYFRRLSRKKQIILERNRTLHTTALGNLATMCFRFGRFRSAVSRICMPRISFGALSTLTAYRSARCSWPSRVLNDSPELAAFAPSDFHNLVQNALPRPDSLRYAKVMSSGLPSDSSSNCKAANAVLSEDSQNAHTSCTSPSPGWMTGGTGASSGHHSGYVCLSSCALCTVLLSSQTLFTSSAHSLLASQVEKWTIVALLSPDGVSLDYDLV